MPTPSNTSDAQKRPGSTIYVVSDGRGLTCRQVLQAALVQFEGQPHRVVRQADVRSVEQVREVVEAAAHDEAVLFYTLVGDETRRALWQTAARHAVPVVDVLGPAFSALHDLFKRTPDAKPGLLYASEREEFDRQSAIDYTLKHDDGRRPDELGQADVVLVGVSRACKSSTCFYLAYQGVKAANVPLVPGLPLLPQLGELDSERVVGLRVNPGRLLTVREARATHLKLGVEDPYLDQRTVTGEVRAANRLMEERGWKSCDVSYMAVEEIAREVMRLRGLTGQGLG